jgi:hypothetical protein
MSTPRFTCEARDMDVNDQKIRVSRKVKYGVGESYDVEIRTPEGWTFYKEFTSHEAVRWWLTSKKIPVENITLQT